LAKRGNYGNELADQLARAATQNSDTALSFNKIATTTMYSELKEAVTQKWQSDWNNCTKAAITKEFFPNASDRLQINVSLNPNVTTMVTGHGRTRAYLHSFRIIGCQCTQTGGLTVLRPSDKLAINLLVPQLGI
jgi:primosomal protein N'